jgi:hypothetical protein
LPKVRHVPCCRRASTRTQTCPRFLRDREKLRGSEARENR